MPDRNSEGVIIIADTIEEKSYTNENELIFWYCDHAAGKMVKRQYPKRLEL